MCRICYTPRIPIDKKPMPAFGIGFKSKYWQTGSKLDVSIDSASNKEIDYIMAAANDWSKFANLSFDYVNSWEQGQIRIGLDPREGSYSFLGTDAEFIHPLKKTLNLGWLLQDMSLNKKGTIRHEFGHVLGLVHEHKRLKFIRELVYRYFEKSPNFWSKEMVDLNILDPLDLEQMDLSEVIDLLSVMMYFYPPGLTKDGKGTSENENISIGDGEFVGNIYKYDTTPRIEGTPVEEFIARLYYNPETLYPLRRQQLDIVADELKLGPFNPTDNKYLLMNAIMTKLMLV